MSKGFVTIPVAIMIVLGIVFFAGASFGTYKYREVVKEKEAVQQELAEQKEREMVGLKQENSTSESKENITKTNNEDDEITDGTPEVELRHEITRTVVEYVPVPFTNPKSEEVVQKNPEIKSPIPVTEMQTLKVLNVVQSLDEERNSINIIWETSINSDSRIILDDGEVFSSDNKDSKSHSVTISNLKSSKKYSYEIVAEVGDIKDSHFGKFQAPREFEVSFEDSENEECTLVVVKDTAGYPLENTLLVMGGSYGASVNIMGDTVREYTNYKGEIEYCDKIERFWVENPATKETYYNAR